MKNAPRIRAISSTLRLHAGSLTSRGCPFNKLSMEKRVTIREVAARAGVHYSSVSLALRNDSRIPAATRAKIKGLATRMGYVPDAALGALAAYRNSRRPHTVHSELAYLTDRAPTEPFSAVTYRYAREQAARLGYNLVEYTLADGRAGLKRLQAIWWNRGVRGVMLGPFDNPAPLASVSWDKWPVVAYGYTVPHPNFNRAVLDHFQNMLLHLEVLRAKGYSRIGFCLMKNIEKHTAGRIHASYLFDQSRQLDIAPVPILEDRLEDPVVLENWIRKNKIEAVIAYHEQYDILSSRGWKIPADLGFSLLTRKTYQSEAGVRFSGFDTKAEILAANAMHFLVSLIHEQARGILDTPRHYMIPGEFHEGSTLRRRKQKSAGA